MFGAPHIYLSLTRAEQFFASLNIPLDPAACARVSDRNALLSLFSLFEIIGLPDVHVLDVDDYEGADIIADLNYPIPERYRGRFNTILDAGTLEHVLDVRRCLQNIVELLAVGGRIIHQSPCNQYVNHGFYQLSPTLFHDYYGANGFIDITSQFIVAPIDGAQSRTWAYIDYDETLFSGNCSVVCADNTQLGFHFHAKKSTAGDGSVVPIQNYYRKAHTGDGEWLSHQRRFSMRYSDSGTTFTELKVNL